MAGMSGKTPRYSDTLRSGIARTLALMTTQAEQMANAEDARYIAQRVVGQALGDGSDWRTWATLDRHLPVLAESAPNTFLACVDKMLGAKEKELITLFEQDRDPAFAGAPHAGLLRALETLAWSDDHFSEAAMMLARLAEIDPGGMVANRPSESLAELFCPVLCFTEATNDERLEVLSTLVDRHPDAGWDALIGGILVTWHIATQTS